MSDREQHGCPQGWKRTTLGEALPIHYGKARNQKYGTVRDDTPVYGSSGRIDTFHRALTGGPSLIIGRKGTVGATYYCPEPCWPIDTVYFTEATADEDLRFFKYLLDHLQLARMDRSTAVPGLSRDDYNATDVFIPELDQQRLIVAEIEKQFSRLDEAVANLKRVKANLKRYKASVLKAAVEGKLTEDWRKAHPNVEPASKLLERILVERRKEECLNEQVPLDVTFFDQLPNGWCWSRIEDLGAVQLGRQRAPKYHSGHNMRPYLRVQNIFEDHIDLEDVKEMDFPRDDYEKFKLKSGDILLNEGQSPHLLGRPAIYRGELPGACFTNTLIRFKAYAPVPPEYPLIVFRAYMRTGRFTREGTITTNIAHLSAGRFAKIEFPVPPLREQQEIVAEVERRLSVIEELEAAVEANLTRADRLRQSILNQAFSGQLLGGDTNRAPDILSTFSIAAESQSAYGKDGHAGR